MEKTAIRLPGDLGRRGTTRRARSRLRLTTTPPRELTSPRRSIGSLSMPPSRLDDVSDEEDVARGPDRPREPASATEGPDQPENWEAFWRDSCASNANKAREAGCDPTREASADHLPRGRHGAPLRRGVPEGEIRCFGCDEPTTDALECCQCLEIFKRRAITVAFDAWERAYWCSLTCYRAHWDEHKWRHGPSRAAPTRLDGREHEFEAAEGNGALWDAKRLRRHVMDECTPPTY